MKKFISLAMAFVGAVFSIIPISRVVHAQVQEKWRTPADFINMMKESDVTYTVNIGSDVKPTSLNITGPGQYAINPQTRVETDAKGSRTVVIDDPKGEVKRIYEEAASKLSQKKYSELIPLYEKALEVDPNFFSTWTFFGDTYYMLGNYKKALEAFKKSIELNPVGYQAYFFMADTYDRMGKKKEALEAITHAYMLNKSNPNIQMSLRRILTQNDLRVRRDRLLFPFEIQEKSKKECGIAYRDTAATIWIPLANCLACWRMEPTLRKMQGAGVSSVSYEECIINVVAAIEQKRRDGKDISEKEKWLAEVVTNHYLRAMFSWEIAAGMQPEFMLTLPHADRQKAVEYIKTFVFERIPEGT